MKERESERAKELEGEGTKEQESRSGINKDPGGEIITSEIKCDTIGYQHTPLGEQLIESRPTKIKIKIKKEEPKQNKQITKQ